MSFIADSTQRLASPHAHAGHRCATRAWASASSSRALSFAACSKPVPQRPPARSDCRAGPGQAGRGLGRVQRSLRVGGRGRRFGRVCPGFVRARRVHGRRDSLGAATRCSTSMPARTRPTSTAPRPQLERPGRARSSLRVSTSARSGSSRRRPSRARSSTRARSSQAEGDAGVRAAEAALETAKLNLEWTVVRAPITGRVSRAAITAGNLVQAGPPSRDAADHDRLARSDLRLLRQRRAGVPQVRERNARPIRPSCPCTSGSRAKPVSRTRGSSTSSTTGSIRAPVRFACAPSYRIPRSSSFPVCSLASGSSATDQHRGDADPGSGDRHGSGPQVRARSSSPTAASSTDR